MNPDTSKTQITNSYSNNDISLGVAKFDNKIDNSVIIGTSTKILNRHGLITGATGTGKTKTMQLFCEKLVDLQIPVLCMDMKGDLSGISMTGTSNEVILDRANKCNIKWEGRSIPSEFISFNQESGINFRSTVTEFGPVLFSKLLDLNDTQQSVMSLVFKYCDDSGLVLIDLEDLKSVLKYMTNDAKDEVRSEYGQISTSTVSTILRRIIELEQQGGGEIFGEPSFDVFDLLRPAANIIRVQNIQDKPRLFSTAVLAILTELYTKLPEVGDLPKPRLVIFIDEAHLIFENATKELSSQLESIIRLIRSKGVGIFFVTQHPTDIPQRILGQLGTKLQHALRAFTPKDYDDIKSIVSNLPVTDLYNLQDLITSLGIGEMLFTTLDKNGLPTPVVHTYLYPPVSRMGPITDQELETLTSTSILVSKYKDTLDKESAHEVLTARINDKLKNVDTIYQESNSNSKKEIDPITDLIQRFSKNIAGSMGRSIGTSITRGILGSIFKK